MHKTKENLNGTFSIGKTWNLDDLSAIESYTGPSTAPDARQRAGDNGFRVTLGKPYYWEAQTDREKKFFIASLVKIYGKYTGGRVPVLSNFDPRELEQVLGGASRRNGSAQPSPSPRPPPSPGRPPVPPSPGRPSLPSAVASPVPVPGFDGGSGPGPEYSRTPSRSPLPPNGGASPASLTPSIDSARNMRSQDVAMRQRLAVNNRSQDSMANSFRSGDDSLRPRSRGRPNGASPYGTPQEPPPPALAPAPALIPTPNPSAEKPPERKRPPMDPLRPIGAPPDESLVPAPLSSSGQRREQSREPSRELVEPTSPAPPPRSIERMSPRRPSRSQRVEPTPQIDEIASTPVEQPPRIDTNPPPPPVTGLDTDSPTIPVATEVPTETPIETPVDSPVSPDEEQRPGLGPMIKARKGKPAGEGKLAGILWKAASAGNTFKPRVGGAGEKLLKAVQKPNSGPDGITAVVPAPRRPEPEKTPEPVPEVPEVKVSKPDGSRPTSMLNAKTEAKLVAKKEPEPESKDEPKRSVVAGNDPKYLNTLGVDPSILDNKTAQFTEWLDFFSWVPGEKMRSVNFDDVKVDIDREMNKAQAGGWLARFQEEDERVDAIKKGIDTAIEECEELDNLLTLYGVELSVSIFTPPTTSYVVLTSTSQTLQDDIVYIEAQGQGLQVQAANQKLLKKELESLLETCAITANDLQALSVAPLDNVDGVEEVETALVTLYKAMLKIDPSMGNGDATQPASSDDTAIDFNGDYAKMRIVQEKKQMYMQESVMFMQRLVEFMAREFSVAYEEVRRAMRSGLQKKVDPLHHDAGRDLLWKYDPLMLYARDVDLENWNRLIQEYQDASHPTYKMEFRDALDSWKRNARKTTGEEALLFTTEQEKKEEGIATAARKLTVKRSQTLARIRSPLGDGNREASKSAVDLSRSAPYEVFASVLDDLLPLVEMEQNFIIDFFHATTLEQIDFPDAVAAVNPRNRRGNDLRRHRLMEPDRDLARRVTRSMEVIFPFLEKDLSNLVDWVLFQSPL